MIAWLTGIQVNSDDEAINNHGKEEDNSFDGFEAYVYI